MKRYLIIAIVLMSVGFGNLIYHNVATQEVPKSSSPIPARTQEGKQPTTQESLPQTPQVFEKDIEGIPFFGWLDPEFAREELERGTFRFQVEGGNRVEGEVSVWRYNEGGTTAPEISQPNSVYCQVRDPFGNIILKSSRYETTQGAIVSYQEYPWQFAFFTATSGEYSLQVLSGTTHTIYGAHLKVTVYEK